MESILVCGAAGFIGSNLTRALIKLGHQVTCIDNLSTGSYENLRDLECYPNFQFIQHDICDDLPEQKFDTIYNLACPASPIQYQRLAIETINACTTGVSNLLKLVERTGATFVHSSTSEVYGDPEVHPQHEGYTGNVSTLTDRACYDEGKRLAETLCYEYSKRGANIRIARIFNTYGPFMAPNDGRVVSNFIVSALSEQPVAIYGNGLQTRSFCFVNDTVEGLIKLASFVSKDMFVCNIGSDAEITILQLADTIQGLLGTTLPLEKLPLPMADPKIRRPDITRAKNMLDWSPQYALPTGLGLTIDYFSSIIKETENHKLLSEPACKVLSYV